ncbi:MAG: ankyrin repeat domain-containing protein [Micropepsaceae bacterium]
MTNALRRLNPLAANIALAILFCMSASLAHAKFPNLFGDAPIVEAVREGSVEKTKAALLDEASVHARAIDGTPLIVLAVAARSLDVVKLLIDNGARPDDKSKKDETTALTLAAANGDAEIVTYLLDHKADIDQPGALRETALIKAVRLQRIEIVKLLLDRGADREETDAGGATAIEIAERNGSSAIVSLLKKAKPK